MGADRNRNRQKLTKELTNIRISKNGDLQNKRAHKLEQTKIGTVKIVIVQNHKDFIKLGMVKGMDNNLKQLARM